MIILTEVNINFKNIKINNKNINSFNKLIFILYEICYYIEFKKNNFSHIEHYYFFYILKNITYFNYNGQIHRESGPAIIEYYFDGRIYDKMYYLTGKEYSYKKYIKKLNKIG